MNDTASIFCPYADLAHLGASEKGGYPKAWVSISILKLPSLDDLGVPPILGKPPFGHTFDDRRFWNHSSA